jgi:hypothetical protein
LKKSSKKSVPICEKNECGDGNLKYNNVCTQLESFNGCKQPKGKPIFKLFVNATSLQLTCGLSSSLGNRISDDEQYYEGSEGCFAGGKRECGEAV